MTVWGWVGECGGSKPPFWKKIAYGEGAKKSKKTNNSAFSATHTYIKLTPVSFSLLFYFVHLPLTAVAGKLRTNMTAILACCSLWWEVCWQQIWHKVFDQCSSTFSNVIFFTMQLNCHGKLLLFIAWSLTMAMELNTSQVYSPPGVSGNDIWEFGNGNGNG